MNADQANTLLTLHHRAVKAAQQLEAATPGTATKKRKEAALDRAEKAFSKAVNWLLDEPA